MSTILVNAPSNLPVEVTLHDTLTGESYPPVRSTTRGDDLLYNFSRSDYSLTPVQNQVTELREFKLSRAKFAKYMSDYSTGRELLVDPNVYKTNCDKRVKLNVTYYDSINRVTCGNAILDSLNKRCDIDTLTVIYTIGGNWNEILELLSEIYEHIKTLTIHVKTLTSRYGCRNFTSVADVFDIHLKKLLREVPLTVTTINVVIDTFDAVSKVYIKEFAVLPSLRTVNFRSTKGFSGMPGSKDELELTVNLGMHERGLTKAIRSNS